MGILTLLWIDLADIASLQLLLCQSRFFLDSLLIAFSQFNQVLHALDIALAVFAEVVHLEGFSPDVLVQIHKHVLLEAGFSVVDSDAVVVAVQAVDKSLDGRFVEVTKVRCGLAWFLAHDDSLGGNEAESIDDDLSFDRLDGIDDDGNSPGCELFKGLLSVNIDGGEPASETGMRVIPTDNRLRSITNQLLV